jgi:3-hydroxybutyryl-CoA dehydratase
MIKKTLSCSEISLGTTYSFEHTFTKNEEVIFGELTGDTSTGNIVHGMLAVSLFSTLIDIHGPGPESIYVSQTLQFRKPIFYDTKVTIRGIVVEKSDSTGLVTIKTEIVILEEIFISGEAKIKLP